MALELFYTLNEKYGAETLLNGLLFRGVDSYIRCLAHILNLIVQDILRALKSGSVEAAYTIYDSLYAGGSISSQTALSKLRILAL
ncbi:hypothetical protein P152DRAFT_444488 [Eremomyces bilateralis CBS 781.70]|uniref:Uncharacterized protein n=1 Tax=Eremomyces bilateralis CBS 781.70 TaxID=1392243 RepID=A0A6G1FQL7_9PEZI|nr:uncharacterized protein P152DRAFT_444488 [Eremomyces bilateralis CBS 781.70]KAF1808084.1 hypothetical protein P152DRAFT_444488 [Eremomyces bilateralis CBS 781.70]